MCVCLTVLFHYLTAEAISCFFTFICQLEKKKAKKKKQIATQTNNLETTLEYVSVLTELRNGVRLIDYLSEGVAAA